MAHKILEIGGLRDATTEEAAAIDARTTEWNNGKVARKLESVKQIRLVKLQATDWMSASDVTMPDYIKTWRQLLRDIPTNHTDANAYDLLLARDPDTKELTHNVWSKP